MEKLMKPEKDSNIKKVFIGLSAFTAFILTIIGVYEFAMKPNGPKIQVVFALNNATEIAIAPTVQSSKADWTDPFPLGFQIINVGDVVAKDVNVSLVSTRNLALISNTVELKPKLIFNKNGSDRATHQIKIPKINPGQTIHLDNEVYGYTENYIDMEVDVTFKDGVNATLPISISLQQTIDAIVTASNMEKTDITLKLNIGSLKLLSEDEAIKHFFQYKDGYLSKYK